jgi:hypothetical protein
MDRRCSVNSRIHNQLNMVGTCITTAQSPEHKPAWDGKAPTDFGEDLDLLTGKYGAISAKHAEALAATGGAADAKASAEAPLENLAYIVARALAVHFKKTGDFDRRGKIDFTKTDIVRLRDRQLVDQSTSIRDIAAIAASEVGAAGRGVTAARVATLSAAITAFDELLNHPRSQIVNRSTLLKEVETDTAALLSDLRDLDDLILQLEDSESSSRFITAWKKARNIVDAGRSPDKDAGPVKPTPPVG